MIYVSGYRAYFDGASQEHGLRCGAESLIVLDHHRSIKLWFNCGSDTNTCAKCMGLWIILFVAKLRDIDLQHIFNDSSLIIN